MPVPAPKREKIEAELGRSLESFVKEGLTEGLTPGQIGRKVELDPATIRYYIKKFRLPYQPEKRFRGSQFQTAHVDICLCPRCIEVSCRENEKAHRLGRCVVACLNFGGRRG